MAILDSNRFAVSVSVLSLLFSACALMLVVLTLSAVKHGQAGVAKGLATPAQPVTKSDFDRIQVARYYPEISSILGSPGEEISSTSVPAGIGWEIWKTYRWQNADGSYIIAKFLNDAMMRKEQFGLK
jgi:hypothetical protein